ncbi:hypothetical protein EXIGLDRAFT_833983 [Exidia glandulosa HHB12029]|uniref:Uncharacterized protein n=1 Tax=Exidia glandulosa HHB12029 TaxID=1314781 RepID=A0A165K828_EXIGL|nr:hypothetical protein EXIGLDRAFT_833983 [Exidia glandulosa HHB12029]
MVAWHDPEVELICLRITALLFVMSDAIYIWEFCISSGFDWDHCTGKRPFRWTRIPYFAARYFSLLATLFGIRLSFMLVPTTTCTMWWYLLRAASHLGIICASLLLAIRVFAVSGAKTPVAVILGTTWLATLGALIYGIVAVRGLYAPELGACIIASDHFPVVYVMPAFVFDVECLALVLYFLAQGGRGGRWWQLLVSQGVWYFVVVILAYVPLVTLMLLNLNEGMNQVQHHVASRAVAICATRMYRNIVKFDDVRDNVDIFSIPAVFQNPNHTSNSADLGEASRAAPVVLSRSLLSETNEPVQRTELSFKGEPV